MSRVKIVLVSLQLCELVQVTQGGSASVWSVWSWVTELLLFGVVPLLILVLNVLVINETRRLSADERRLHASIQLTTSRRPSVVSTPRYSWPHHVVRRLHTSIQLTTSRRPSSPHLDTADHITSSVVSTPRYSWPHHVVRRLHTSIQLTTSRRPSRRLHASIQLTTSRRPSSSRRHGSNNATTPAAPAAVDERPHTEVNSFCNFGEFERSQT